MEEVKKSLEESKKRLKIHEDEITRIREVVKKGMGSEIYQTFIEEFAQK